MAIEEVLGFSPPPWKIDQIHLTCSQQEFSIEIPDKEADAIHSGKYTRRYIVVSPWICSLIPVLSPQTVDQAVQYILSQPDGKIPQSPKRNE